MPDLYTLPLRAQRIAADLYDTARALCADDKPTLHAFTQAATLCDAARFLFASNGDISNAGQAERLARHYRACAGWAEIAGD